MAFENNWFLYIVFDEIKKQSSDKMCQICGHMIFITEENQEALSIQSLHRITLQDQLVSYAIHLI